MIAGFAGVLAWPVVVIGVAVLIAWLLSDDNPPIA